MYEASISIEVRRCDNGHTVKSQIMTAAPGIPSLMAMLSSMLMSHTDVLVEDVNRQLPNLEAETIQKIITVVPDAELPKPVPAGKKKKHAQAHVPVEKIDDPPDETIE